MRSREPLYGMLELRRPYAGFERPWLVTCNACVAGCSGVGACPGDAMSALPCPDAKRRKTREEEIGRDGG